MTALTAPATAPRTSGGPRLTVWLLRLHRPALYTWVLFVLLAAALLLALRGPLADAAADGWRHFDACQDYSTCRYDQNAILRYKDGYDYATVALSALPLAVAAWAGAALVGRELESGTATLTWSQAVSPARWLTLRLAVPALAVTAGSGLLVLLHHLAWSAGRGRIFTAKPWYDTWTFHANGPTTVALALAGLAAGAFAGLLWRRALPALVLALLFTAALRALVEKVMPHLWPAVTTVGSLGQGAPGWGVYVDEGLVTSAGAHVPRPPCYSSAECGAAYARLDVVGNYHTFHPYSHYWPLQLTTTAALLAVTGLLVTAAFLVLRRRTGALRTAPEASA